MQIVSCMSTNTPEQNTTQSVLETKLHNTPGSKISRLSKKRANFNIPDIDNAMKYHGTVSILLLETLPSLRDSTNLDLNDTAGVSAQQEENKQTKT